MGARELLVATGALILGVAAPRAQGPAYRERWGYLHLERLRDQVFRELLGRDATVRRDVAELLAEPDLGLPFAAPAKALARLRGVEADDAFLLRATLGVFLLPEVVDPDAATEVCRDLNATVFLPFSVAQPGALELVVTVRDAGGAELFRTTLDRETDISGLRRARPVAIVPGAELADGSYRLEVAIRIDGTAARPTDPRLRATFHVLRGYQARAEAAMQRTREVHDDLPPLPRALLLGLGAEVSRAYAGEAFDGVSTAVEDLGRLEKALANLADGRHVLHGIDGDVATAVPAGDSPLSCVLRLPAGRLPTTDPAPRPLVVVAGGAPAYDPNARRPTAPAVRGPRWLARELADLGSAVAGSDVAFLASPGNGRDYGAALTQAIAALRDLLGTGDRPVVLVCEREAGAVAGFAAGDLGRTVAGLVLIGAGAIPIPILEELGPCAVRVATLQGYPSSQGLERTLEYVKKKASEGAFAGDFERLTDEEPAWPFGARSLVGPIEAFVRDVVGG